MPAERHADEVRLKLRTQARRLGQVGATSILLAALAACAGSERPAPAAPTAGASWGDRTYAMIDRDGDPRVAYFEAGEGSGRIFVWEGGETAIVRGEWRLDGNRLCATLGVVRRESSGPRPPLRPRELTCHALGDAVLKTGAYKGDVFSLHGLVEAPYILSQADNERLVTVLHDAERMAR